MESGGYVGVVIGTIAFGVLLVLLVRRARGRQQRMRDQRAHAHAAYTHLVEAHAALFVPNVITPPDVDVWRARYPTARQEATTLAWRHLLLPADAADATACAADLCDLRRAIERHNARLAAHRASAAIQAALPMAPPKREPYRLNRDCLTPGEARFFRVLQRCLPPGVLLWPKLRLGDLFWVPPHATAARRRIEYKHVDFVLADAQTLRPLCGIELDDRSHERPDRQVRDAFVKRAFDAAELPLVRVPVRARYDEAALRAELRAVVNAAADVAAPTCPTCQAPMERRTSKRGASAVQAFYGCTRYPDCRGTRPLAREDSGGATG